MDHSKNSHIKEYPSHAMSQSQKLEQSINFLYIYYYRILSMAIQYQWISNSHKLKDPSSTYNNFRSFRSSKVIQMKAKIQPVTN